MRSFFSRLTVWRCAAIAIIVSLCTLPLAALAQAAGDPAAAPPQVDIGALFQQLSGVVSSWKTGGWIAGMIALTYFVVSLTKLSFLDKYFAKKTWLRPFVAVFSGALIATLTARASGQPWITAAIAGVMAGLGSSGLHELLSAFSFESRVATNVGNTMVAIAKADGNVDAHVNALQAQLNTVKTLAPDDRMAALASWANSHPPVAPAAK
jgi:hypothetical protein